MEEWPIWQSITSLEDGFSLSPVVNKPTTGNGNETGNQQIIIHDNNTPHHTVPSWEEGMTEEDHRQARENEEKLDEERKEKRDFNRNLVEIDIIIKPHFTTKFNQPIYLLLRPFMVQHKLDIYMEATVILVIYVLLVAFIGFLVAKITHLASLFFYVGLMYYMDMATIPIVFIGAWIVFKILRIFSKKPEDSYLAELHMNTYERTPTKTSYNLETFVMCAMMVGFHWLLTSSGYFNNSAPLWIVILIIMLAKVVPGVGGNSTLGIMMTFFIALLGLITLPDVWRSLCLVTKNVFVPPMPVPLASSQAAYGFVADIKFTDIKWITLFYTYDNPWDIIRRMITFIPIFWLVNDDYRGPGLAMRRAVETNARNPDSKIGSGRASIYSCGWWIAVIVDITILIVQKDWIGIFIMIGAATFTTFIWNIYGRSEWIGRGEGMTLTNVRPGWRVVFGQGPEGLRIFIIQICAVAALFCLAFNNGTNLAIGLAIFTTYFTIKEQGASFVVGVTTLSPVWFFTSIINTSPMTDSLNRHSSYSEAMV